MGELTKTDNAGKMSPGPVYLYHDQTKYDNVSYFIHQLIKLIVLLQAPGWAMGTEVRVAEDKPRYDFYENALFLDDPVEADINRKHRICAPKIGTEPRFNSSNLEQNPGP